MSSLSLFFVRHIIAVSFLPHIPQDKQLSVPQKLPKRSLNLAIWVNIERNWMEGRRCWREKNLRKYGMWRRICRGWQKKWHAMDQVQCLQWHINHVTPFIMSILFSFISSQIRKVTIVTQIYLNYSSYHHITHWHNQYIV